MKMILNLGNLLNSGTARGMKSFFPSRLNQIIIWCITGYTLSCLVFVYYLKVFFFLQIQSVISTKRIWLVIKAFFFSSFPCFLAEWRSGNLHCFSQTCWESISQIFLSISMIMQPLDLYILEYYWHIGSQLRVVCWETPCKSSPVSIKFINIIPTCFSFAFSFSTVVDVYYWTTCDDLMCSLWDYVSLIAFRTPRINGLPDKSWHIKPTFLSPSTNHKLFCFNVFLYLSLLFF